MLLANFNSELLMITVLLLNKSLIAFIKIKSNNF